MIERLIYSALSDELDELERDPTALTRFLQLLGLSSTEAAAVRTNFEARRPMIVHNYPRLKEVQFPLYAIILDSENESTSFVGDFEGMITEEQAAELGDHGLFGRDVIGALFSARYSIWTAVEEHPDRTLYYYQIAKYALMKRRDVLKAQGIIGMRFSGRDFRPEQTYMPSYLFVRRLDVECVYDFSIVGNAPADSPVVSVGGIYVQDGVTEGANVVPVSSTSESDE